jgi:hypothetical protein
LFTFGYENFRIVEDLFWLPKTVLEMFWFVLVSFSFVADGADLSSASVTPFFVC